MSIKYLKYEQINKEEWDKCINSSVNGIIYAFSWYLDIVSPGWTALVKGNYDAVMPITGNKKYGISYIFQPIHAQQLGVFTKELLDEKLVNEFVSKIPSKFKVVDINLNLFNKISHPKYHIVTKVTYELDLIRNYFQISSGYNSNTQRNLKKSKKNTHNITKHVNLKDFINLIKNTSNTTMLINDLMRIIPSATRFNMGDTYGAYDDKNNLMAVAFFLRSHNKAIYLAAASTEKGKESRAMFSIVDAFIHENAEKNITLDFEGSMVEGIARFYKGFGATPAQYLNVKRSIIPFVHRK